MMHIAALALLISLTTSFILSATGVIEVGFPFEFHASIALLGYITSWLTSRFARREMKVFGRSPVQFIPPSTDKLVENTNELGVPGYSIRTLCPKRKVWVDDFVPKDCTRIESCPEGDGAAVFAMEDRIANKVLRFIALPGKDPCFYKIKVPFNALP